MSKEFIFELDNALYKEETGEAVFKPKVKGELVRCGECKYFIEPSWECRKLIDRDAYGEADARVYPDYFCADGERKDGAE